MKCIIVNDDTKMKNIIEKLIRQTEDMQFIAAFNTTSEASEFLKNTKIDVVFFDIQMYYANSFQFLQSIPEKTFVIYIPEFSPFVYTIYKRNAEQLSESIVSKRFIKGVNEARIFLDLINKENRDIPDDYFVI
jgi:two-component SAPR family response regulator